MVQQKASSARRRVDYNSKSQDILRPLPKARLPRRQAPKIQDLVGEYKEGDGAEYYRALTRAGWGLIRMAREHNIQPYYPYRNGDNFSMPISESREHRGVYSESLVINGLDRYLKLGGEILI